MLRRRKEKYMDGVEYKANKTVAGVLTWIGTAAAEAISYGVGAASWVQGVLLVVGGAANAAAVYYTENKPKYQ
jgi:hypothetical protein